MLGHASDLEIIDVTGLRSLYAIFQIEPAFSCFETGFDSRVLLDFCSLKEPGFVFQALFFNRYRDE